MEAPLESSLILEEEGKGNDRLQLRPAKREMTSQLVTLRKPEGEGERGRRERGRERGREVRGQTEKNYINLQNIVQYYTKKDDIFTRLP